MKNNRLKWLNKDVTMLVRDNMVVVILPDGRKGEARCAPDDDFDLRVGIELALDRAKREPIPSKDVPNDKKSEPKPEQKPKTIPVKVKWTEGKYPVRYYGPLYTGDEVYITDTGYLYSTCIPVACSMLTPQQLALWIYGSGIPAVMLPLKWKIIAVYNQYIGIQRDDRVIIIDRKGLIPVNKMPIGTNVTKDSFETNKEGFFVLMHKEKCPVLA